MARALPVSPDSSVIHTSFSALASLGLEESVVVAGPADGIGMEAIAAATQTPHLVPLWVPVEPSVESTNPVPAATPVAPVEPMEVVWGAAAAETLSPADVIDGPVAQSAPDPLANVIWVPVNASVDAMVEGVAERGDDLSFLELKPSVELRADGFFGSPDSGAESMPFDAAAAARPGGGGGTSGAGSAGAVVTEYKSGAVDGTAGYDIWIQFKGTGWTAELQSAFKNAADYFTGGNNPANAVITADIGGGGRIGKVVVDDLWVTAEVKAIDGAGGILGQAGPSNVWTANYLTAAGQMQFDVADALNYLGKGLWDDIVTHEMMHVLGFGSLWEFGHDLVTGDLYTGSAAAAAYGSPIPVETDGGSGTAGSHWDEQKLVNELMTGYINDDGNKATINDNYLSKFSVMSLADLGYTANYRDYSYDGTLIT